MPSLLRSTISIAFALATAFASAQTPAPNGDYRLGAGDAIRVQVYQNPDLTVEARVSESGSITYPLVGKMALGGLTIGQAEGRIAQALRSISPNF